MNSRSTEYHVTLGGRELVWYPCMNIHTPLGILFLGCVACAWFVIVMVKSPYESMEFIASNCQIFIRSMCPCFPYRVWFVQGRAGVVCHLLLKSFYRNQTVMHIYPIYTNTLSHTPSLH